MEAKSYGAGPIESTSRDFNQFEAAAIESTSRDFYPSGSTRPEHPAVTNEGVIDCYTYLFDANYLLT